MFKQNKTLLLRRSRRKFTLSATNNELNLYAVDKSAFYYWKDYKLKISTILSNQVLDSFIKSFYEEVISIPEKRKELKSYAIIFKIEFTDLRRTVRSISP